ncbi:MAG: hypothetical protein WC748_10320 [Legionellales bacterium]|jgi:hypothetical protein
MNTQWKVIIHNTTKKQLLKLPEKVNITTHLLCADLEEKGPIPGKKWPNYGKFKCKKNMDKRHCHLIKGNPTYVACWEVLSKHQRIIEVYYVGTHEKAPY